MDYRTLGGGFLAAKSCRGCARAQIGWYVSARRTRLSTQAAQGRVWHIRDSLVRIQPQPLFPPFRSPRLKAVVQISLDLIDRDALLLERVALAHGHGLIFHRVPVNREAIG